MLDDAMVAAVCLGVIHLPLLLVHVLDHPVNDEACPPGNGRGWPSGIGAKSCSIWPGCGADTAIGCFSHGVTFSGQDALFGDGQIG